MPPFIRRAFAGLIASGIARELMLWVEDFAHGKLALTQGQFNALAAKYLTAPAVDTLVLDAYAKLPEAATVTVFRHTFSVPLKSVVTPDLLALMLAATASGQGALLDQAHAALTAAYAAALKRTAA